MSHDIHSVRDCCADQASHLSAKCEVVCLNGTASLLRMFALIPLPVFPFFHRCSKRLNDPINILMTNVVSYDARWVCPVGLPGGFALLLCYAQRAYFGHARPSARCQQPNNVRAKQIPI